MLTTETLDAYATLFEYPSSQMANRIEAACRHVDEAAASPCGGARGLLQQLETGGADSAEEHFTRVFDVNAARSLEMGWHLYGEDYARGAFMVQMRQMLRQLGVEEGTELPDYLPSLLRGLGRLPEGKAAIFSTSYLQPALAKMAAGFGDLETPYADVLSDLLLRLEAAFGPTPAEPDQPPAQATPYEASPHCPSSNQP